jgi:predicted small lipoprotein YifL
MKKQTVSLLLSVLAMFSLASCGEKGKNDSGTSDSANTSEKASVTYVDYNVTLNDIRGKAIEGAALSIMVNGEAQTADTDETGLAVFYDTPAGNYTVTATLPDSYRGYSLEDKCVLTAKKTDYTFKAVPVISSDALTSSDLIYTYTSTYGTNKYAYKEGDVIHDFSFTDVVTEKEYKITDLLKEYDCVCFDFFYAACPWCIRQYPVMTAALSENYTGQGDTDVTYQEKVCVIGIDTLTPDYTDDEWTALATSYYNNASTKKTIAENMGVSEDKVTVDSIKTYLQTEYFDTVDDIKSVKSTYHLPYLMSKDVRVGTTTSGSPILCSDAFNITGDPSFVAIDRYGLVAVSEAGYNGQESHFTTIFDKLLDPDYVPD